MARKQGGESQSKLSLKKANVELTTPILMSSLMFKELKEILPKELKKNMRMMTHQIDSYQQGDRNYFKK